MESNNKLIGAGGSYNYNSTTAYNVTAGGEKTRVYAIQVFGAPVLETLEDADGDCLAKYGFVDATSKTLSFGMLITAKKNKPFTQIKFSTAGAVVFYREG